MPLSSYEDISFDPAWLRDPRIAAGAQLGNPLAGGGDPLPQDPRIAAGAMLPAQFDPRVALALGSALWSPVGWGFDQMSRPFYSLTGFLQSLPDLDAAAGAASEGFLLNERPSWVEFLTENPQWLGGLPQRLLLSQASPAIGSGLMGPLFGPVPMDDPEVLQGAAPATGVLMDLALDPMLGAVPLGRLLGRSVLGRIPWVQERLPVARSARERALYQDLGRGVVGHRVSIQNVLDDMHEINSITRQVEEYVVGRKVINPATGVPQTVGKFHVDLWIADHLGVPMDPAIERVVPQSVDLVRQALDDAGVPELFVALPDRIQSSTLMEFGRSLLGARGQQEAGGVRDEVIEVVRALRQRTMEDFLDDLLRRYARLVPMGESTEGYVRLGDTAARIPLQTGLRQGRAADYYGLAPEGEYVFPEELARGLETVLESFRAQASLPGIARLSPELGPVYGIEVLQEYLRGEKQPWLRLLQANAVASGLVTNLLSGVDPRAYRLAKQVLEDRRTIVDLGRFHISGDELWDEIRATGVLRGTTSDSLNLFFDDWALQTAAREHLPPVGARGLPPETHARLSRDLHRLLPVDPVEMDRSEAVIRLANYIDARARGEAPREAAERVSWLLGNTTILTPREIAFAQEHAALYPPLRELLPRDLVMAIQLGILGEMIDRVTPDG